MAKDEKLCANFLTVARLRRSIKGMVDIVEEHTDLSRRYNFVTTGEVDSTAGDLYIYVEKIRLVNKKSPISSTS